MKRSCAHSPAAAMRVPEAAMGTSCSLIAPSPPASHTTPRRFEIDAAPPFGLDLEHFACLLGGFGFVRRLYDWLRSGDCVFQLATRLPQQGDRPLPAFGKMVARFLSLRLWSSWSPNWT